jgi:Helix-turn-helix.
MRRLHGYTQETLAEHLNTTRSHIGKIEIGKEGLSMDLYVELKAMFHTTLDYLVLGEDTPAVHVEE